MLTNCPPEGLYHSILLFIVGERALLAALNRNEYPNLVIVAGLKVSFILYFPDHWRCLGRSHLSAHPLQQFRDPSAASSPLAAVALPADTLPNTTRPLPAAHFLTALPKP